MNSFNTYLSIKNNNNIHISYSSILLTMFDNFLLLTLFHPFILIDLKIPVKVSRIIADATAINNPYMGANRRSIDAIRY